MAQTKRKKPDKKAGIKRKEGSNPSLQTAYRNKKAPTKVGAFHLGKGYKKDIFAVFAYEFELSQLQNPIMFYRYLQVFLRFTKV